MRLNGKASILAYLGRPKNTRSWYKVLLRYGTVIRMMYPQCNRGYWTRSEDIDAVDDQLSTVFIDTIDRVKSVATYSRTQARRNLYAKEREARKAEQEHAGVEA